MAAVLVCLSYDPVVSGFETSKEMGWFNLIHVIFGVGFLGYMTFKTPFQLLYGSVFAVLGLYILGILLGEVDSPRVSLLPTSLFLILACLSPAYLLIFDRDIARYRKWVRVQCDQKCRLNPKVDNLSDDPINHS